MNKVVLWAVPLLGLALSAPSHADNKSTVSLGYANTHASLDKLTGINMRGLDKDAKGISVSYARDIDGPWGIMGNFTYTQATGDNTIRNPEAGQKHQADTIADSGGKQRFFSWMVGPTYRIDERFKLYGLAGITQSKSSSYYTIPKEESKTKRREIVNASENKSGFAYGAGVQINVISDVLVDLSYRRASLGGSTAGTWTAGLGMTF
ncbi:Ail/Lom family outer membrane beta-barrel protein [Sodalis endosymbiont of Spalangia cameroni]|uniref:Ail/Lom family outer membrane beta-barrel protein n=1 Tax=Sodalis praecaptivus TaxID=1239307 RepID=UPI0031F8A6E4